MTKNLYVYVGEPKFINPLMTVQPSAASINVATSFEESAKALEGDAQVDRDMNYRLIMTIPAPTLMEFLKAQGLLVEEEKEPKISHRCRRKDKKNFLNDIKLVCERFASGKDKTELKKIIERLEK